MLLFCLFFLVYNYTSNSIGLLWFGWVSADIEFLSVQVTLLWLLCRLFQSLNMYQLLGYSFVLVVLLCSYLLLEQLDVFACFLIVSESVIFMFALSMVIHLNINNIVNYRPNSSALFVPIVGFIACSYYANPQFSYIVDWYASQTSQYNDLVSQYVCLYIFHNPLIFLVGFWLLALTFLLVALVTYCFKLGSAPVKNDYAYLRKYQSMWGQWYSKPILNLFTLFK